MQTVSSRPFLRLAVIGALIASLGLAACGRKGPLDPPPGAALDNQPQPEASSMRSPIGGSPIGGGSSSGGDNVMSADGRAQAPKGPKKRIPLDVLLN